MDDTEETSPTNTSILVYLFHTKSTVFFNFFGNHLVSIVQYFLFLCCLIQLYLFDGCILNE